MKDMGLSANPNKTLRILTTRERLAPTRLDDSMDVVEKPSSAGSGHVVGELQSIADLPTKKRERISEPMVEYCIYMMDKYGDDFKAMARDIKNYYQDTPKQIRKKITWFKNCKVQYKQYLALKKPVEEPVTGDVTMN